MFNARDHLRSRWRSMHSRCKATSGKRDYRYYSEVKVCEEWDDFENFYCWAIDQSFVGKHLDKDIIGNSLLYGPDTCVLVNPLTNFFFQRRVEETTRGVWYNGSSYVASCSNPFTSVNERLGNYDTIEEARMAYLLRRHYHACLLADYEEDVRVKDALFRKCYIDESIVPLHVILKLHTACEKYS